MEWVVILYAAKAGLTTLRNVVLINMVAIALFGGKLVSIFGSITNVGNLCYAAVVFGQILILRSYGQKEAYKTIPIVLISLAGFTAIALVINSFTTIPGNELASNTIDQIVGFIDRIIMVSFIAYSIGQVLLIKLWQWASEEMSEFWAYLTTISVVQLVDSIIFFPLVFSAVPFGQVVTILGVGLAFKIAAGLSFYPIFRSKHLDYPR